MGLLGSATLERTKPYAANQYQEVSTAVYERLQWKEDKGPQPKGMFHPHSLIALVWSYAVLIFDFIYLPFILPVMIGFVCDNAAKDISIAGDGDNEVRNITLTGGEGAGWARAWNWLAGAIYLVDIAFKMNTGVVVAGPGRETVVMDRQYIMKRYLNPLVGGTFVIDLISVLAFIYEIAITSDTIGDQGDQVLCILRLLRLLYVIRFSIWIYMKSLSGYYPNASLWDRIPNMALLCGILMHTILGCMNIMACALFTLARWEGEENSWVAGRDGAVADGYHIDTPLLEATQWRKYLDSVFWAMDTWTTVGFGNPAPIRWVEQVMVLLIEYMYIFFFSLTAGLFGNVLSQVHESTTPAEFRGKMGNLAAWLDSRKLNYRLRMKVKLFYLGLWSKESGWDAADFLSEIPEETRDEILNIKAEPVVRNAAFLKELSNDVREAIASKMMPKKIAPGDSLFVEGGAADSFFVIETGYARVTSSSGGVHDVGRSQVVGLSALFAPSCPAFSRRLTTPVAMNSCEVWEIKIADLPDGDLASGAWAFMMNESDAMAIEFGVSAGMENKKKAAKVDLKDESLNEFAAEIVKQRSSSPVLNFKQVVEGMYDPTTLGLFQPSQKLLRVNAEEWGRYVEDAQKDGNSGVLVNPTSKLSVYWTWFMAIFDLTFAVCVLPQIIQFVIDNDPEEPYPLSIVPEGSDRKIADYTNIKDSHTWGRALLWIAGVIYFLDMVSGFITGFAVSHSNKALVVKDPTKVFKYYLTQGGFLVDLVSVIPFIYEICAVRDVPGDQADQILNILRLFARYGRVYWILKEIYVNSVINHWSIPTYPFFDWVQPTFVYFGYVIYTLFGVINWIGALMYVVARWRGLDESWVALRIHLPRAVQGAVENDDGANCLNCYTLLGGDVGHGPSEWEHWVAGIFYGIDVLLTNGNGEPHPVTWNEEIAALIVMVFQVYYFGFVIGATLDLFKSSRNVVERADTNRLKMKAVESFFLTRRLPRHLQIVIQSFYTEVWSRIVDFDEAEILEGLPSNIRGEVVHGMLEPVYKKMELFEMFTPDVLLSVSSMLKPSLCSREATLYKEGDPAQSLYILEFGNVVATENGVNRAKIQGPSTIGEEIISVGGRAESEPRREFTVESESSCFLWILDAASLDAVEKKHPGTKETLQSILSGMHSGSASTQGSPLKKRTSSLRRVMSEKSMGTLNDAAYFSEPLPPMAYQPRSFDVSSAEWFRLMSVPESERKSPFIINPHSLVALYSSSFMFAFDAIYTAFVMPALVAFVLVDNDDLLPDWAFALEVIAGLIFIASMLLNMTTGYIAQYDHRSTVVMRRQDVLVHYIFHGGVITDVLSVLPFFYEIIARAEGGNENAQLTLSILRMLRLFRVFRVLRLIWNVSFSVSTKQLGWMLRAPDGIGRVLKAPTLLWMFNIFYVFMFFSNFCGSVLYILGKAETSEGGELGDRSWIAMRIMPTSDGELLFDDQRIMRYLHSVYWAMDTLTTVGFGDPWPNTWQEDLASMLVMFIAVLLFSVIFASTSTVIKSLRDDVRKLDGLRTRMKEVIQWMDDRGFTAGLKKVVRSYYSDKLSSANNLDVEILLDMPDGIRSSVLQYVTQDVMNHLDLFKNMDRMRKEMIAGCLTPMTVASGHDLFERDDLPNGIYLLEGGTLDAFRGSEEIGRVSGYATIGDYALVQTREPHPVTVRAKTPCYLWHLEMSALEELCRDDSTLMIELVGGQEHQMRTAWARTDGGFLDTRVGGGADKGSKATKPMLGRAKSRYSLRNVARYHDVSPAKWGTLFTGAEDYSASKEEEYHKANLVAKKSGMEVPLSPDNPFAIFWSGKMMVMDATYTSFILPVVFCFGLGRDYLSVNNGAREVDMEWWVHMFEWYAGIVFIINMLMNMATGFVAQNNNQKVIVMGLKPVLENYIMRGTFIIDILSVIPFFMYFAVLGGADGGGAKHAYTWMLLLRFVPRFVLFLMDLASTCFAGNNALPVIVDYTPNSTFYFMLTVYMTALTLNVLGCFYFFAAVWRKTRPDDSWLSNRDIDRAPALEASIGLQYLDSIYWCSDTLTTVGYGDPQPTTWEEMLVAMVIMTFNIYFFILIESAISELLRDTAELEEFRKMKAAKRNWVLDLMGYWGVPSDTQRQVIGHYEEKWTKTKAFDEDVLMGELPNTVRSQVAMELKHD
ncbi:hypothetical protein BSKO_01394 [Bryopsis sp. KO-2023]|nr:hypothetical protein BSKO_01394 [Bryopsis sp. KO-2023]